MFQPEPTETGKTLAWLYVIEQQAQRLGDMFEPTNDSAGRIARCKVGDFVITLGPDSAAPDSRIVFEAKEDRSYSKKDALIELQKA